MFFQLALSRLRSMFIHISKESVDNKDNIRKLINKDQLVVLI